MKICRGRVFFSFRCLGAFIKVLFSSAKGKSKEITAFEHDFAEYNGSSNAIAVSSGKVALYLILKALNAQPGDEIIVPAYTVPEVIDVIIGSKLRPVFIDISLADANMDYQLIENNISKKTKFILMTYLYGNLCSVNKIIALAKKHNLLVIEDAAQACGAEYEGRKAGSLGYIGYFSFGILKNLNTLGGGMIITEDDVLAVTIRQIVGSFRKPSAISLFKKAIIALMISVSTYPLVFSLFIYPVLYSIGKRREKIFNSAFSAKPVDKEQIEELKYQFSGFQAAVGIIQLARLDERNMQKIHNAQILNEQLAKVKSIALCHPSAKQKSIYLNYVIRVKNRIKCKNLFFSKGIDISEGFIVCCAHLPRFREFYQECPNSAQFERENLYIPIYPPLGKKEMLKIASLIQNILR